MLDTHVVIWLASEPGRLSKTAVTRILEARESGEGLAVSCITLIELTSLSRKGRLHPNLSLESFLQEIETRFSVLPVTGRACMQSLTLPADFPQDPADRVIAGTALAEGLALITADRAIRNSRVIPTIW